MRRDLQAGTIVVTGLCVLGKNLLRLPLEPVSSAGGGAWVLPVVFRWSESALAES